MNSLLSSVAGYFTYSSMVRVDRTEHLARRIDRSLPQKKSALMAIFSEDHDLLLDAVDHMLTFPDPDQRRHQNAVRELQQYFADARSVYGIQHVSGGAYEIQYRQPSELTSLVESTLSANTRASEHLRRAWSNAFSRDGSPNDACFEAAKAIEAVAGSVILPNNPKVTLGQIIASMEGKISKWETDVESAEIDDIDTVIGMMKMIWKGHLRHGNPNEPLDVSVERAAMIVHLAVLLVHWFSSERIRLAR